MDLHQIEIFCALVKLRSFSKAADMLLLTQPTVSGHIKNLESELGVRLLDRIGKRVVPTEAGEALFHSGQKLLALRTEALDEIKGLSGEIAGSLKIGASTIPGAYVLPDFITAFKKKYPTVSLHLAISDTAAVTAAVLKGELHIGIVGAKATDSRLEAHPFLDDELVVAVRSNHPWAKKKNIAVEDLLGEPFILREDGSGTRRIMEDRLGKAGFGVADLREAAIAGSSDAVRESIKAGLGVSILSVRAIRDDIKAKRLTALRIKGIPMDRAFSILLLKGRSRSALCKTFLDFLLKKSL